MFWRKKKKPPKRSFAPLFPFFFLAKKLKFKTKFCFASIRKNKAFLGNNIKVQRNHEKPLKLKNKIKDIQFENSVSRKKWFLRLTFTIVTSDGILNHKRLWLELQLCISLQHSTGGFQVSSQTYATPYLAN